MDLSYMAFIGDLIWIIFPLIVIFFLINAMGGNKGRQDGQEGAPGLGRTRPDPARRNPENADPGTRNRAMDPDRNLDSRDVMDSPKMNGESPQEAFPGQQAMGGLGDYLKDLLETKPVEPSAKKPPEAWRLEPLSTMKKVQEDQRAERDVEREKRYAYDGQSAQSKSSTRDQAEREKRYSYDRQGYESKASNRVKPPEAVLQRISTAVAMSSPAPRRKESFLGGMGSEFLDSADQYLRMGDYHLTHKPGGLYSYPDSRYGLKALGLDIVVPEAVLKGLPKGEDRERKDGMGRDS